MAGKTALVTGGTAGIGYATAGLLAAAGARVVITGRDRARGMAAEKSPSTRVGASTVRFVSGDHSTEVGNLAVVDLIGREESRLDLLVNNVGGVFPTRQLSDDGVELTLALNLRAAVVLTTALRSRQAQTPQPRVVNVASDAYARYRGDPFADVQSEATYQPFAAYARAKLLLVLATGALSRDLTDVGVMINAVNPGMAWTPNTQALTRQAVPAWRLIWPVVRFAQRRAPAERAAAVVAQLAAGGLAVANGEYVTSAGKPRRLRPSDLDPATQQAALALGLGLTLQGRA